MRRFIFALFVTALIIYPVVTFSSGGGNLGGGAGGVDTTSIARDGSRPPTSDQGWGNNNLSDVNEVEFDDSVNAIYTMSSTTSAFGFGSLTFQNKTAGGPTLWSFKTADSDGTDNNYLTVFASGDETFAAGTEELLIGFDTFTPSYVIQSTSITPGTRHPIEFLYFSTGFGVGLKLGGGAKNSKYTVFSDSEEHGLYTTSHPIGTTDSPEVEYHLENQTLGNDFAVKLYKTGGKGGTNTSFLRIGLEGTAGGGGGPEWEIFTDSTGTGVTEPIQIKNATTGATFRLDGVPQMSGNFGQFVANANGATYFEAMSNQQDGTEDVSLRASAFGNTNATNAEWVELVYSTTGAKYELTPRASGTGVLHVLNIYDTAMQINTSKQISRMDFATSAADSTTPTLISLPTGGTAAQAGWVSVSINGTTSYLPFWQ